MVEQHPLRKSSSGSNIFRKARLPGFQMLYLATHARNGETAGAKTMENRSLLDIRLLFSFLCALPCGLWHANLELY